MVLLNLKANANIQDMHLKSSEAITYHKDDTLTYQETKTG